ncbi:mRNA interferase RelE/StbE [Methylomagnum ishizawai]|uniref:mRNA interferase RelE/StbE n=1 Tax=Methylomagnum ishizawai TaxID=1760988 RepID=A0A1Y6D0Z5_9GAMM|nr:type II toxin-antitoxin system RelE/ParE family toxin [Methylomagnum ishizawai]SMF94232.1 mRNA interferase RelE/StbE [Methylomagnum ishizawai]
MRIELRKSAVNDLKSLPKSIKDAIHTKIAELTNFPNVGNIKKLTNFEPAYRLRVGDYRVLFDVENDQILVGRVLHRKESYKR